MESLDVVPVAIHLICLDQVGEHESGGETPQQLGGLLECSRVGRAWMLDVDPNAVEQLADLPHRVNLDPVLLELLQVASPWRRKREVASAVGPLECSGVSVKGPRDHA